jgi:hypothetical protein
MVERDQDPTDVSQVQQTKQLSKVYNLGYIAKVNISKTQIISVYLDRKTASHLNGYKSVAYLDAYVKSGKLCDNHYYILYDTLDEQLKKDFLHKNNIKDIILYKSGIGQYNKDGILIQEFRSKHHCQETLKIGEKSLNKALLSGLSYDDFMYKVLDEKLVVV